MKILCVYMCVCMCCFFFFHLLDSRQYRDHRCLVGPQCKHQILTTSCVQNISFDKVHLGFPGVLLNIVKQNKFSRFKMNLFCWFMFDCRHNDDDLYYYLFQKLLPWPLIICFVTSKKCFSFVQYRFKKNWIFHYIFFCLRKKHFVMGLELK